MGSRTPPGDGLGPLLRLVEKIQDRLATLETATGTSVGSLLARVELALSNITTTVQAAIAQLSYTRAEIDAKDAVVESHILDTVDDVKINGTLTATGEADLAGGLRSLMARNLILTNGMAGGWLDVNGRLGINPSSARYKKDIETWAPNMALLMQIRPVLYRYKTQTPADDRQVGFIAEELEQLGPWTKSFLYYEEINGQQIVQGINYERLTPVILAFAQSQQTEATALKAKVAGMEVSLNKVLAIPLIKSALGL